MIRTQQILCQGQSITEVEIYDIPALISRISAYLPVIQQVTPQAMNANLMRNPALIAENVLEGLIGNVVINEIFSDHAVPSTFEMNATDGFYLQTNQATVKVKTSVALVPPCPDKHITKFSIQGHPTGTTGFDYYVQIVFCGSFDLTNTQQSIFLYIVGALHQNSMTGVKHYPKESIVCGTILGSQTIQQIIPLL